MATLDITMQDNSDLANLSIMCYIPPCNTQHLFAGDG